MTREQCIEILEITAVTPMIKPDYVKVWDDAISYALSILKNEQPKDTSEIYIPEDYNDWSFL